MTEIHFDFLNFNNILILLVILAIGGYLYYEIHKMKLSMNDIHNKLNVLMNNFKEVSLGEVVVEKNEILPQENNINIIPPEPMIEKSMNIQSEKIHQLREQMNKDEQIDRQSERSDDSRSESSDDSRSESSDDSRSESSDSESKISQSEIEKNYGKEQFERENNNASIDDILSDKNIITDNSLSDILNVDSDLTKIDEFIQNIKSDKEHTVTKDYNDMTVSELKKVLVDMNLPVSGNKTKLIERILENKK